MKIRKPWLIQTLCMIGYWLLRLLLATVFCKYWRSGQDFRPVNLKPHECYIYAMWHEYLLVPIVEFSHSSARLLVSQHADGLIVAEICKHLRMGVVRGSSTRGGVEALRRLLRPGRFRCLAVIPDGPRGPRRKVQPGIIYLASKLGWPIVPVGIGYQNPWRLRSWDRLAIPKPFHPAAAVSAEPFVVPGNLDRDGLESYRQKLEATLEALTAQAEWAAATGQNPNSVSQPHDFSVKAAA
jgi:lysophospholipid acyltransferase (LPLAT)-like uncharacterized protein